MEMNDLLLQPPPKFSNRIELGSVGWQEERCQALELQGVLDRLKPMDRPTCRISLWGANGELHAQQRNTQSCIA